MNLTDSRMLEAEKTVQWVARKLARGGRCRLDLEDLLQVGRLAAFKALQSGTYDPEGGASFGTYCRMPVRTAMRAALRGRPTVSLDAPVGDEGDSTFLDLLPGLEPDAAEELERAERDSLVRAAVDKALAEFEGHREMAKTLVERLMEGGMVEQRFRSETSLADIAARFGVSRQYVGVVESKLKARLAGALEAAV